MSNFKNPVIAEMAKKYGVSAAQLCIRYVLELGAAALPKTADPEHMKANAAVDFTIVPADMEILKHAAPNDAYAQYFTGHSFLKPLTVPGESPAVAGLFQQDETFGFPEVFLYVRLFFSSGRRLVMLLRLMPSVDILWSSAEVVGGRTPATPSTISEKLKPTMNR